MTDHATEQIALFMNARDHRDYGTAIWSELDIVGREAYLTDAAALVAAVKALGWAPALTPTEDDGKSFISLTPTGDEREALADRLARRLIEDPKQLMLAEGTGALHVALSESIRSVIEDVYADCGDSDAGVLSSNIARSLAWDLPPAILSAVGFRRSEVPEPSADDQGPAASCHLCVGAGGYEGHDGEWVECSCQRPKSQGEPSDVQAAEEADRRWPHTPGEPDTASARSARRLSFRQGVEWARAASSDTAEPNAARLLAQGFAEGVNFIDDQPGPWGAGMVAGRAEAARRRAAATEQGEAEIR